MAVCTKPETEHSRDCPTLLRAWCLEGGIWWVVSCTVAAQLQWKNWIFLPSIPDCVQRHPHACTENTHATGEEVLYPLWQEEPGTGLMLLFL